MLHESRVTTELAHDLTAVTWDTRDSCMAHDLTAVTWNKCHGWPMTLKQSHKTAGPWLYICHRRQMPQMTHDLTAVTWLGSCHMTWQLSHNWQLSHDLAAVTWLSSCDMTLAAVTWLGSCHMTKQLSHDIAAAPWLAAVTRLGSCHMTWQLSHDLTAFLRLGSFPMTWQLSHDLTAVTAYVTCSDCWYFSLQASISCSSRWSSCSCT